LFHLCGGIANEALVFTPRVGRPVWHVIPKVVVEAVAVRPAIDGFGEIDLVEFLGDAAALLRSMPTKMPFANHARGVALRAKHFRQRKAGIGDERALPFPHDAALETAAPIVPPRQ
jgi:hypothetical protein